jgi:hypothetical protein
VNGEQKALAKATFARVFVCKPRIVAYARRVVKLRDGRIDGNGANA